MPSDENVHPYVVPIKVALTDTEQYHRLVYFLDEMHQLAEDTYDDDLMGRVEACRDDLIECYGQMHDYTNDLKEADDG